MRYQAAVHQMLSDQINQALSTLTDREHKILRMRFGLDNDRTHTLEEIGCQRRRRSDPRSPIWN